MSATAFARVYRGTPRNLARLARVLREGGLVAVPTETVYGLAANALDAEACRRIFVAKGRPADDPLIVHIHAQRQLNEIAVPNDAAVKLAAAFWPGPLTMVLPKRAVVPGIVTSGLPSVAVRMPRHPVFRRLLRAVALPLAAPSANPFGYISPTCATHVRASLGGRIKHILDGGPAAIGLESTIVDLRRPDAPRVLRPGAITASQIESVLGTPVRNGPASKRKSIRAQLAPGLLDRHYSPRTPSVLHPRLDPRAAAASSADEAWIFLARPEGRWGRNVFWLDARGDLRAAGRRLFDVLRRADAGGFTRIHLESAPDTDVGIAINDRLRRAAAQT